MRPSFFRAFRMGSLATAILACGGFASAEPQHGIAMYGEPALPPDFVSFPYANPEAPKGGRIVLGETGSFDSLNPHILKGRVPWMLRFYGYESLMDRNYDEPFTLYGLLAESVETNDARTWVEFTLREEARFSDGSPVTAEDVLWSFETLGTIGHPRYLGAWEKVETAEITGPRSVKFTFNTEDRELPLILGMRPILKKAQWDGKDFTESGLTEIPIASSPYVVDDFQAGRYLSLKRNPDYWGKDLPVNKGRANVDEIRMEFFTDGTAMFEAFKAGVLTSNRETDAAKWDMQYDFPAVQSGKIVKSLIPHQRPTGIEGFVMNTRLPQFQDWRVREAMITLFNFEFINETINGGTLPRISSYYANSVLGMDHGPAEGRVAELLAPYAADLPPGTIEGYSLPVSDGSERNRTNTRKALALFEEAGWTVQDGVMKNAAGEPFTFEIVLSQGSSQHQAIIDIYVEALSKAGIVPTVTTVESAQYKERTNDYDFGMTYYRRGLSLSPGNEQFGYWGSAGVTEPGSRNYMGMNSPAAEAMINTMLTAESQEDFRAAVKGLDRVLTAGRYVIPIWYFASSRIAHDASLKYPEHIPMYGDWIMYQPDVWWVEE
ncbi:extracellular solute-binding protein [Pseudoruegeria sp. SHC-113]|uniref:extracellular solute-binding protein n=1 Tax=Pseudoruegeria sp. SHC-113 TaxID=2855439 RepID=UPI0039648231|nr:extracellular solute-binding protein [Pseudoruegeria sp. SHC-113]